MKRRIDFGMFVLRVGLAAILVAAPLLPTSAYGADPSVGRSPRARTSSLQAKSDAEIKLADTVILATNSIDLGQLAKVMSGDVVANDASAGPFLSSGVELNIGQSSQAAAGYALRADSIKINNQSQIASDVIFNQLNNSGTITGDQVSPVPPPGLPFFPGDVFGPCATVEPRPDAQNYNLPQNSSLALPPGEYGDVKLGQLSSLTLSGGEYTLRSLDVGQRSNIRFQSASTLRVSGRVKIGQESVFGPAAGSGIVPSDIFIAAGGINGTTGTLSASPKAVEVGQASDVLANVCAPNGTLKIEQDTDAVGSFFAKDVQFAQKARIVLDSFFQDRAPVANSQVITTAGALSVEITLTGSDPEGKDLVFAIQGAGPTNGTLSCVPASPCPSPIVSAPMEDPENPGTFVQPPVTSATVTYTPTNPDLNEEDAFTFSVTDPEGGVGMAVVTINPFDPSGPPPAPTVVSALDEVVDTTENQPETFSLDAEGPGSLTYCVLTLPAGSLRDSDGMDIEAPNTTLPGPVLKYTPPANTTGPDSFLFEARTSGVCGGVCASPSCDSAQVSISISDPYELAPNGESTGNLNEPQVLTLVIAPGGVGDGGVSQLGIEAASLAPDGAAIAGNVSATNGTTGDGKDNLPGPAPILVAAGVDVNLGSSSGTVTDASDDATASPNDDPDPDVISATVGSDGTNLNIEVRFSAGSFSSTETRAQILVDTDQNPATGHPGSDSGCTNDNGIIGAEFLVNVGADLGTSAEVLSYNGTCNSFSSTSGGTVTFVTDGMDATVPLSLLGSDDGLIDFKVTISEQLSPGGFTGVLDYMPDVGQQPGDSTPGVRGIARIQIEWDISNLNAVPEAVNEAIVTLPTRKGTVDDLDTFFFAGTADQDGLLQVSDFQAPATQIPNIVMPVPPGAQTNDEGTFQFNVTSALKSAIASGFDFFSIQGRVNEGLAGGGFRRGLQVYSTAAGNLLTGKQPQLEVTLAGEGADPAPFITIVTLPTRGVLTTLSGAPVSVGNIFQNTTSLVYTPNLNEFGDDGFQYNVTETIRGITTIDSALILIAILNIDTCVVDGRLPGCAPGVIGQ